MICGKKVLTIIPARGGSKRLHKKNLLSLSGKPLIAWTIEAAKQCPYIDRTIVSTECPEIKDISIQYGADVPFVRPQHLATDEATTIDVVLDIIEKTTSYNEKYDFIALLQPTSPLRTSHHLAEALEQLTLKKAKAIISVCQTEHHPLWCNTLPKDLSMNDFINDEIKNLRSQDLPIYYRLNGAMYICDAQLLEQEKTLLPSIESIAYKMTQQESIDIDSEIDFKLASLIMESSRK
jgi:CMP-N,N'-diacetyllegionaminic acid synthase